MSPLLTTDPSQEPGSVSWPSVSIVIPTYNSAATLPRCLDSCLAQGVPPQEIVVVDDVRTTDATRSIATDRGVTLLVDPAGMAESRNVGARSTTGDYILHIDSDMILDNNVISKALAEMQATSADAIVIAEQSEGTGPWASARELDKQVVAATQCGESARLFKRAAFTSLGGYDPALTAGEDADMHRRLLAAGFRVSRLGTGIRHNEGNITLASVWAKKYKYGLTAPRFVAKHGPLVPAHNQLRRLWIGLFAHAPITVRLRYCLLKTTEFAAFSLGQCVASHEPYRSPHAITAWVGPNTTASWLRGRRRTARGR